jgi:hypothetical protein
MVMVLFWWKTKQYPYGNLFYVYDFKISPDFPFKTSLFGFTHLFWNCFKTYLKVNIEQSQKYLKNIKLEKS